MGERGNGRMHTAEAAAAFELGRLDFDIYPESSSRWFELSLAEAPRGPLAQAARDPPGAAQRQSQS